MGWKDDLALDAMFLRVINGLRAITIQPYDEANKKTGTQWESSGIFSFAGDAHPSQTLIVTGSLPVDLKSREFAFDGIGVIGRIFKGATYDDQTGSIVPWYNMNTGIAGQPETLLIGGATILTQGTKCGADINAIGPASQQGKGSPQAPYATNRILQPNTVYLLEIETEDDQAQRVASRLEIYEGGLDLPNEDYD